MRISPLAAILCMCIGGLAGARHAADADGLLSLSTAYVDPPRQLNRLLDLTKDLDDRRMLRTTAKASLFQGDLKGDGEISYGAPSTWSTEQRGNSERRQIRFGLTGGQGTWSYGLTFREAGKMAAASPDQATREIWGEWRFGLARLRTSVGETWNNVDRELTRQQVSQTQNRVGLILARPAWPEFSLTYARMAVATPINPDGLTAQRRSVQSYESALGYNGSNWNARASAGYMLTTDELVPSMQSAALIYGINGTYRFERLLAIIPSLAMREELQRWSGIHVLNRSGSITLAYTPASTFSFMSLATYNDTCSTDGLINITAFSAKSTVTWMPESLARYHASFALETSHKVTYSLSSPFPAVEDTTGLVRVSLTDIRIW